MELKDIISVPGMSGLFKVVGNNKNGFIVESVVDNKRSMISSTSADHDTGGYWSLYTG